MSENITIKLRKSTIDKLDSKKTSNNETYDEIIENLLEDSMELSKETQEEIQNRIKEYEKGEFFTLTEVKKQLNF